jgi:glycerol-3-phosphate acyltransferase PlsY
MTSGVGMPAILLGAWLLGGLPTGVWLARGKGAPDPTRTGSVSSGATNVGRLLGWRWGVVVLVLDLGKGLLAAGLPLTLGAGTTLAALAGLAAVLGHCASPWARFRGGKGVATGAGAALVLAPAAALAAMALMVVVLGTGRRMAPSSLAGAMSFAALSMTGPCSGGPVWFGPVLFLMILTTHRQNVSRLWRGVEPTLWGPPAGDPRWRSAQDEPLEGAGRRQDPSTGERQ